MDFLFQNGMQKKDLQIDELEQFYGVYLATLEDDTDLMEQLQNGYDNFPKFINGISDDKLDYAYEEGKWTVAQALLHIVDSERIFQYRAFRFSRQDKTPLMGFDQDDYVLDYDPRAKSKESIVEAYKAVRSSTIAMFKTLGEDELRYTGIASNLQWSVASLGFVICGHQRHHRNIIRERYL
jgi:hypothetical protein